MRFKGTSKMFANVIAIGRVPAPTIIKYMENSPEWAPMERGFVQS